ncbi:MAG: hypothetical protein Q4F27_01835 [Desulfovibrionaceae bacterium]|nr:hypothetical protein [Desulfovibrionaceae bacterium]
MTHAQARNESDLTVKSIALDIRINNARQKQLLRRFLNAACDIMPGENLDKSWTIELDGQSEEGRALLAAGALICSPAWRTLSLSSSEVLHVEDLTPTLEPCALAGHEHPHGLCLKPIFSR